MNGIKQRISDWQPRKLLCFSAAFSFMALLTTLCVSYHIKDWYLLLGVLSAAGAITLVALFKGKLVPFTLGLLFGLIWCVSFVHICYFPTQRLSGYGGKLTLQVLEIPDTERPEMLNVRVLAVGEQDGHGGPALLLDELSDVSAVIAGIDHSAGLGGLVGEDVAVGADEANLHGFNQHIV